MEEVNLIEPSGLEASGRIMWSVKSFSEVYVVCDACGEKAMSFIGEILFLLLRNVNLFLVNAADNKQRDKNMTCIKISIDP